MVTYLWTVPRSSTRSTPDKSSPCFAWETEVPRRSSLSLHLLCSCFDNVVNKSWTSHKRDFKLQYQYTSPGLYGCFRMCYESMFKVEFYIPLRYVNPLFYFRFYSFYQRTCSFKYEVWVSSLVWRNRSRL